MPAWENFWWNRVLSMTSHDSSGSYYIRKGKVHSTWFWFQYLFCFSRTHDSPTRGNLVISLNAILDYLCLILLFHWIVTPYFTWLCFSLLVAQRTDLFCSVNGLISLTLRTQKHRPSLGIYWLHWKTFLSLSWD